MIAQRFNTLEYGRQSLIKFLNFHLRTSSEIINVSLAHMV